MEKTKEQKKFKQIIYIENLASKCLSLFVLLSIVFVIYGNVFSKTCPEQNNSLPYVMETRDSVVSILECAVICEE